MDHTPNNSYKTKKNFTGFKSRKTRNPRTRETDEHKKPYIHTLLIFPRGLFKDKSPQLWPVTNVEIIVRRL